MKTQRQDIKLPILPAKMMSSFGAVAIAASTWTKMLMGSIIYDPSGCCNLSQSRYIAPVAGLYRVTGRIPFYWYSNPSSYSMLTAIYKNGALLAQGPGATGYPAGAGAAYGITLGLCEIFPLLAKDYVELWGFMGNASTCQINNADATNAAILQVEKVG